MRTNIPNVRHVLNLETAVSLIASYFYSNFLDKLAGCEKENKSINWSDISVMRYIDWSMTTPLMLLVLSLVLSQNIGKVIKLSVILTIITLNYIMLYLGYLGEIGMMSRFISMAFGFVALFGMFFVIFYEYVLPKYHFANYVIFAIFSAIWILYGVFFMMSEGYKNIGMNVLDCLAKCCFGLGLWAYYSKIVRL